MSDDFNFSTEVRVRLPETDAMGIVFHGNYFTFLEVGRVDYLRNLDLSDGIRPIRDFENVVVAAHLDFRSPARLDDEIIIDVRIDEIRTSSLVFGFRLRHKRENRVIAEGYTTHCAIDDDFRPTPIPESFRAKIEALLEHACLLSTRSRSVEPALEPGRLFAQGVGCSEQRPIDADTLEPVVEVLLVGPADRQVFGALDLAEDDRAVLDGGAEQPPFGAQRGDQVGQSASG